MRRHIAVWLVVVVASTGIAAAAKAAADAAKKKPAATQTVGSSLGSALSQVGSTVAKAAAQVAAPAPKAQPNFWNAIANNVAAVAAAAPTSGGGGSTTASDPSAPPNPGDFTGPASGIPGGSAVPPSYYYDPTQATSFLQQFGIDDKEVQNVIDQVFRTGGSPEQALAALRGTKWYANNYQGIFEGIAKGIVSNEADYRNMLNQTNQLYQRYYGKQIDAGTFANYLKTGTDIGTISRHLSGESAYNAAAPTLDYQLGAFDPAGALTATEQQAYGDQLGGLQNPLGDKIALRVQQAQQRIAKVFQGSLASPGLTTSNGRLAATTSPNTPDLGA